MHSLLFWWRDYGKAERGSLKAALSPCYLNTQYALDVSLGIGTRNLSAWLRSRLRSVPLVDLAIADCLAPPHRELQFPRDLYADPARKVKT